MGLSVFEKNFRQHEITGDILPLLTIVELKDMDAKLVGPRTILLRKLAKLKRAYVNYQRNRPLWDGEEERYTNPFEMIADFVGSCCCPDPADKYVLTSSHLKLTHNVYPMGKALRCCSKGTKIHTIDLSLVVDVDASSQQTCCGGRDMVVVEHEKKEEGDKNNDDKDQEDQVKDGKRMESAKSTKTDKSSKSNKSGKEGGKEEVNGKKQKTEWNSNLKSGV